MQKNDNDAGCIWRLFREGMRLKYCWLSCFIFVFLFTGVLVAQVPEKVVPQTDIEQKVSEPEKPVAIPITKISDRAQETYIVLNKIEADLKPTKEILTIKKKLVSSAFTF